MSRAMNVNATEAEVVSICATLKIATTAIELLLPSGIRVVCKTSEGALALRNKMKSKLIAGAVKRAPRSIALSVMA